MYPTDPQLGEQISQILIKHNLENPVNFNLTAKWQDPNQQQLLHQKLLEFFQQFGIYATSEESQHTASRLLEFWQQERFYGLNYANFPNLSLMENSFQYLSPLIAKDIEFTTTCEHHLVPVHGKALIAYQANNYLIGLGKLNCILEFFSHRPQLQERLTKQVHLTLQSILETDHVAIVINARHDCVSTHGICDYASQHTTYQLSGVFLTDLALKQQILAYAAN